jgi:hypothetical protein
VDDNQLSVEARHGIAVLWPVAASR